MGNFSCSIKGKIVFSWEHSIIAPLSSRVILYQMGLYLPLMVTRNENSGLYSMCIKQFNHFLDTVRLILISQLRYIDKVMASYYSFVSFSKWTDLFWSIDTTLVAKKVNLSSLRLYSSLTEMEERGKVVSTRPSIINVDLTNSCSKCREQSPRQIIEPTPNR